MWKNKQWFVGVEHDGVHVVFSSYYHVTQNSHGMVFDYCFGGYKTKKQAIQVARWQTYVGIRIEK